MSNEYVWATIISPEDLPNYHPDFARVFHDKVTTPQAILSVYLPSVITHAAQHQSYMDDHKEMQWRVVDISKYRWSIVYRENQYGPHVVLQAVASETMPA